MAQWKREVCVKGIRLGFGHKARSGKDCAAKRVLEVLREAGIDVKDAEKISFAKGVYQVHDVIQQIKPPYSIEKDPKLLQATADFLREYYGENFFTLNTEKKIVFCEELCHRTHTPEFLLVTDLRHRHEAAMLKKHGFKLVDVFRKDRPIDRDPNHPSETDLDDYDGWDYVLDNNGPKEELKAKVAEMLDVLFK
jgi:hypothetical protein